MAASLHVAKEEATVVGDPIVAAVGFSSLSLRWGFMGNLYVCRTTLVTHLQQEGKPSEFAFKVIRTTARETGGHRCIRYFKFHVTPITWKQHVTRIARRLSEIPGQISERLRDGTHPASQKNHLYCHSGSSTKMQYFFCLVTCCGACSPASHDAMTWYSWISARHLEMDLHPRIIPCTCGGLNNKQHLQKPPRQLRPQ